MKGINIVKWKTAISLFSEQILLIKFRAISGRTKSQLTIRASHYYSQGCRESAFRRLKSGLPVGYINTLFELICKILVGGPNRTLIICINNTNLSFSLSHLQKHARY